MSVTRQVLARAAGCLAAAALVFVWFGHGADLLGVHEPASHTWRAPDPTPHPTPRPTPRPSPGPSPTPPRPAPETTPSPSDPDPATPAPSDEGSSGGDSGQHSDDHDGGGGGGGDEEGSKNDDCDPLEFDCKIAKSVNGWFASLAKSSIKLVFGGMGDHLIHTPQVDRLPRVEAVWQQTLFIANAAFVLLVMAGGVLLMGHETVQTSYSAKQVAPRLIVAFLAANYSDRIVGWSVEFANSLADALVGGDLDTAGAVSTLGERLSKHMASGSIFLILLVLVAAFLGCALAITYALRVMVVILLLVGGPLALACHALPQTENVARVWWRFLAAVVIIQVVQSLVFIIAIKVMFTKDGAAALTAGNQLWDMVLVICLLYVLIRVPAWVIHLVIQGAAPRSPFGRVGSYLYLRHEFRRATRRQQRRRPQRPQPPQQPQPGGGAP